MKEIDKALKAIRDISKSTYIRYWCDETKTYRGRMTPIRFRDGVSGWHMLTREKVEAGIKLMRELFPSKLEELFKTKVVDNPEPADILIQLALFGDEYVRST
jgi:hypothetical protein